MSRFSHIISKFNKKNILVIGDIILDRYVQGSVSRISPEAPVPVVLEEHSFYTPGGAANVASNLCALGAKVTQVGRTGNDFEGQLLKRQLKKIGIDISGVFTDAKVPTITKTRIVARQQQICRIDKEKTDQEGDKAVLQKILEFITKNIHKYDGVIISDYGKGLISQELLSSICSLALNLEKIITVDPKVENFCNYRGVTAITPNKSETENAIRNIKITHKNGRRLSVHSDKLRTFEEMDLAGQELLKFLDLDSLLMTLGEHGMKLFERDKKPVTIETQAREVFDVSGAGDTVISVFTLALTAKATKKQAAQLANMAAGVVVGKLGAVAITKEELLEASKS